MFGKLGLAIRDQVIEKNREAKEDFERCGSSLRRNDFASDIIFNYATTHIFPYTPILNRTVFKVFGQPIDDDTTNNVERWIGILKNLHFKGEKNMKPGRLARSHKELISGTGHTLDQI